jgi:predicted alpha/beta-fold hydrolase
LLRPGYNVVMMDARAHGASEGPMATYGWLERNDSRAVVEVLRPRSIHVTFLRLGSRWERGLRCNPLL